jgi:predicted  nucleic acid-binding Zn-ribbon protein
MSKNLFNINEDIFRLHQQIEENGGELTAELEEQLTITENDRESKCEGYVSVIRQLKSKSQLIKDEAKRLLDAARVYDKSVERLEDNLLSSVVQLGNIKTNFVSISTRRNKSVEIADDAELPLQYQRVKIEANKTAIKEAIESGIDVPGATIVEKFSLLIR